MSNHLIRFFGVHLTCPGYFQLLQGAKLSTLILVADIEYSLCWWLGLQPKLCLPSNQKGCEWEFVNCCFSLHLFLPIRQWTVRALGKHSCAPHCLVNNPLASVLLCTAYSKLVAKFALFVTNTGSLLKQSFIGDQLHILLLVFFQCFSSKSTDLHFWSIATHNFFSSFTQLHHNAKNILTNNLYSNGTPSSLLLKSIPSIWQHRTPSKSSIKGHIHLP